MAARSILTELGPFDERLHMYAEDIDLCLRAQRAGIETVFAPDAARLIHIGHRSAGRRYGDLGQSVKIAARTWVVRENHGAKAAAFDWICQLMLATTRLVAKKLARRDASFERAYVRAALRRPIALTRAGQIPSDAP